MTDVLYIAAKAPRAGFAKTRLGRAIGHEAAISLYKAFLEDLAARFSEAPFPFGWYVTPADAWAEISALTDGAGGRRVLDQGAGDWAERQGALFRGATERGERYVVLIGSDCPHLSIDTVEEAFRLLDKRDLVLSPTRDGGYCLIGMRDPREVLRGVEMSTGAELEGILKKAQSSGSSVGLLEPTFDVDEAEDLQHLRPLLERADLSATRDALDSLGLLEGRVSFP